MSIVEFTRLALLFAITFSISNCHGQSNLKNEDFDELKRIENAPFSLYTYTLKNGLKLYLAPNDEIPKIRTSIMVRAGSEQEPDESTGLAHYLEHLLFKGTDKIGALDFKKEEAILGRIETLYEKHKKERDTLKRKKIFEQIDSLSFESSKYSNSQEYTQIMKSLGMSFFNATTNVNRTGYINAIPSNQLEKWLLLEAERFRNPQFRTFHTELESVYEEMNIVIDNPFRYNQIKLIENLFNKEQYRYKHPIGEIEHLKNPSIKEVKEFYKKYYIPNNMAILLVGNFKVEDALKYIEKSFSQLKPKYLPKKGPPQFKPLQSIKEESTHTVNKRVLMMGYRFDGYGSKDALLMEFTEMMLYNGIAGFFDTNIINQQKVGYLSTTPVFHDDFSVHVISAEPNKNQSLKEVRDIILKEIDKVKKGDFPDWLIDATRNLLKKNYMSLISHNNGKIRLLEDAFINDIKLMELFDKMKKFDNLSKNDIVDFVKKHYVNYSVIYGKPTIKSDLIKINKPKITALNNNSRKSSEFKKSLEKLPTTELSYDPIKFKDEISKHALKNNANLFFTKNKVNDLFDLKIVFDTKKSNPYTQIIESYLKKGGTTNKSQKKLQQNFLILGSRLRVYSDNNSFTIRISGLSNYLDQTVALVNELITDIQPDEDILLAVKEEAIKTLDNINKNKPQLSNHSMKTVLYGKNAALEYVLTERDLKNININEVISQISNLLNSPYELFFYGNKSKDDVLKILNKELIGGKKIKQPEFKDPHMFTKTTKDKVYLNNFKSKKIDFWLISKIGTNTSDLDFMSYTFNSYFNDILNTELRESRGLAYSVSTVFQIPSLANDKPFLFYCKVGTQNDKYEEAIKISSNLIKEMPLKEEIFNVIRQKLLKSWKSHRIINNDKLYWFKRRKNKNLESDPFESYIEGLENLTFDDFKIFYNKWIKNNPIEILIVGDLEEISQSKLKQFGEIIIIDNIINE